MNASLKERQPEKALKKLRRKLRLTNGKSGCTLNELCAWTGLSRSQILYLEEKELIVSKRAYSESKKKRPAVFYSTEDVLKALIIGHIRHSGFSLQELRTAIKNLRDLGLQFNAQTHLLTDGSSIQAASDEHEVVDILRHKRQMMLLVSIEDQIQKVERIA